MLILWATGFGATSPPTSAGIVVTGRALRRDDFPLVTLGGTPVTVIGAALGGAGLYQIAIQLPANVPAGAVAIQASVGSAVSPSGILTYVAGQ